MTGAIADPVAGRPGQGFCGHRLRLLIVEREATRVGISLALGDGVEVCGEAEDAERAIRVAMREQPDVALVGRGAMAAVRGLCRAAPSCAVVVLAESDDPDDLLEAVRAGAVGYVPGPIDSEALRRVVRAIADGQAVVPRAMVRELVLELRHGGSNRDGLSNRESQVVGMLRRGHSTSEIACRLQIAPVTVRRHISDVMRKLGVADRAELCAATGDRRVQGI